MVARRVAHLEGDRVLNSVVV
jgi:hypothetical protein